MTIFIKNTVIRDNIDNKRFIHMNGHIRSIIDTPIFQRLRSIKQNGLTSLVFPGSVHTRFLHSLGVLHTANLAFNLLKERSRDLGFFIPSADFSDDVANEFAVAALCHDIGHTAFSHALEDVLLPEGFLNHEQCSVHILTNDKAMRDSISTFCDVDAVVNLLQKSHPNKALCDLISGAFDVDRGDYILRDSFEAGVEYGSFDLKWVLHSLIVEINSIGQPVLQYDGPRGLDALRQFLAARRHMYRQVYLHATVRSAQFLLKSILVRAQLLGEKALSIAPPPQFSNFLKHKNITFSDFQSITDVEVDYFVRLLANFSEDNILQYLSNSFVSRQLPKAVLDTGKMNFPMDQLPKLWDESQGAPYVSNDALEQIRRFVSDTMSQAGHPPELSDYAVFVDAARFKSAPPTDIHFVFREEVLQLDQIDPACVGFDLASLTEQFTVCRIFVPKEVAARTKTFIMATFT